MSNTNLEWRDGVPFSIAFNDIYYQPSGLEESRHVFLTGNDLPARWSSETQFTIVELGLGTALNFLTTWKMFEQQKHCAQLHYYGIELYPLKRDDLQRAHSHFPDIRELSAELLPNYPPHFTADWHWRNDRINLSVLWGDVLQRIKDLPVAVDAWYLDGFAPAQNPAMWQAELFKIMAEKSRLGTTFATFTVARAVRDAAAVAGFDLQKRKGFGRKRDMLTGVMTRA